MIDVRSSCLTALLVFGMSLFMPVAAHAWIRSRYSDPEVVQRAELIVVAHIKEGSIVYVPHVVKDGGGMSWEHHGTLLVAETIKGTPSEQEVPIIFHYGLDPLLADGRRDADPRRPPRIPNQAAVDPNSPIIVYDVGGRDGPVSGDIRQDQIWFLRAHESKDRPDDGRDSTDTLGLWDPQDVQPLELKPYFQAFLTDHPETKLKEYAIGHTPLAVRSQVYLDHLQIEAILKEPDINKRADMLLPLCLYTDERAEGPTQREAMFQMWQSCGHIGVSKLVLIFDAPKYVAMQCSIMYEWANAQYHEAIPLLMAMLGKENKFWAGQTPAAQKAWVTKSSDYNTTTAQNESRVRMEAIFYVFRQVPDVRTLPILKETKQFWDDVAAHVEDPRNLFSERCDDALMSIQNAAAEQSTK